MQPVRRGVDLESGRLETLPQRLQGTLVHFVCSPDGARLLVAVTEQGGTAVRSWDLAAGTEERLVQLPAGASLVGLSPDGRRALLRGDKQGFNYLLSVCDLKTGRRKGFARPTRVPAALARRVPSARPASPPSTSMAATSAHLARRNRP